jgi:uncharacterized membrane protein
MKTYTCLLLLLTITILACQPKAKKLEDADLPPTEEIPAKPADPISYRCAGTEPFWSLRIMPNGIEYDRAGEGQTMYPYQAPSSKGDTLFFQTEVKLEKMTSRINIKIWPGSCSDGMSDNTYPYEVRVTRDGEVLQGCGE